MALAVDESTALIADRVVCAAALLLFVLAAGIFFFSSGFTSALNSDAAVPVLLADEILRKGTLLPTSWYYVNGEIWVLSPQLFALPFVAALGVSPLALKLGNIAALVSMVACLTLPIQRITRSWPFAITVALGVLAISSRQHMDVIYEQAAYGWICAKLALLIFFSVCALGSADDDATSLRRWTNWNTVLYLLLLIEFAAGTPLRALVYWGVPATLACIATPSLSPRQRRITFISQTCVALLIGVLLHAALRQYLVIVPGVGAMQSVANWPVHLRILWAQLPLLVQYQPTWPSVVLDLAHVATFARCLLLAGAATSMLLVWRKNPPVSIEGQFLARLAAIMFAVVLAAVIVGVDATTLRYLVPPTLICLAAFMTQLRFSLGRHRALAVTVMVLFVFAFCGGAALLEATPSIDRAVEACDGPVGICDLQETLQQHGLHKGYATYWHANVTTLVSRGAVVVCGLILEPRLLPFRWLVSKDCFVPPQQDDRYFIALARSQTSSVERQRIIIDAGVPNAIARAADYEIWIYEGGDHHLEWLRPELSTAATR